MSENVQLTELLIFDADCGVCTKLANWGQKNLNYFPTAVGFQHLDYEKYGLTLKEVQSSIWLIEVSGPPKPANRAVSAILKKQPKYFWRFIGGLLETYWIQPFAKQIYYLVAANRDKLPGATQNCEIKKNDE